MAVQAQYPSNILLLNRNIEKDNKDFSLQPQPSSGGFIEQSHMLFDNNGVGSVNPRKRRREFEAATHRTTTINNNSLNFSLHNYQQQQQNQSQNQFIDLTQLQNHHHHDHQHSSSNNVVSTGLRLSFSEQNQQLQRPNKVFSLVSEDFDLQFKQQTDELFYFLHCQGEQLRRTLIDKRQQHYHALLSVAKEAISQRMREKEVELEKATRKKDELEAQAAQLSFQAQEWKSKAQVQEAHAQSLKAQLQQASRDQNRKESGAHEVEDAESAYVDSMSENRVVSFPSCKMCCTRVTTVVILPCRHLCVCRECDNVVQTCPLCFSLRSGSIEVYFD